VAAPTRCGNRLCRESLVGAEIETFQVGEIDAALDHVRSGRPRYRVVLEM
jgi:D-arabinose 1-dehydrogenase-like Zn-dependent alcohol dehydrogenase